MDGGYRQGFNMPADTVAAGAENQPTQLGPGSAHPGTTGEVKLELEGFLLMGDPHARGIIWDLTVDESKGELYVLADTRPVRGVAEVRVFDREGREIKAFSGGENHFVNFIQALRNGRREELNADIEEGHRSTSLSLLGMLSLKLGRSIEWDGEKEECPGDAEANALLDRPRRKGWELPELVIPKFMPWNQAVF